MDDLSFARGLDREPASSVDGLADERSDVGAYRSTRNPPPAYRTARVLDGLSAYAAVFGCSGSCAPAET